jgi:hypothetical protein
MNDMEQRTRDLSEFANAEGQSNQPRGGGGHALVRPTSGLAERVIGAQPVAVYRDEHKVMTKIKSIAAAAGPDWFYRFPVRKQGGGQDWIEGPSIKLANDVARIFGNNVNEVRELDVGDAWVFYARFTDIETGFSMERAYRQRKSQTSMKTKDADRQLDIAYQIGQSKAIRNCIVNSLQIYADYAFEEARNSLVEKIGKDLDTWRDRTLTGIKNRGVDLARVERVIGRGAKDWLAPNIAQVIAMMKSIVDGMASADEVFPPIETTPASQPDTPAGAGDGGEQGTEVREEATAAGDVASDTSAAATRDPAAAESLGDAITAAYERGRKAKADGHQRKAIPPELRDPARTREALAWQAGHDGTAMPEWK